MSDDRDPPRTVGPSDEAAALQDQMIGFVRAFGLLRPDATPCDQPLSASEAHALLELGRDDGLTQGALGGRLGLEKSTVSRLVSGLERHGWVDRRRDAADARVIRLRLTAHGRQMAARVARARARRYQQILDRIPPAARGGVLDALAVLTRAAKPHDEAARDDEG